MVQQITYAQEIRNLMEQQEVATSSSLNTLHPIIDKDGLLRVGGRLQQSTLPYHTMHQMTLPANHHITKVHLSAEHISHKLSEPQLLIASLRDRYWKSRIRNLVKTVTIECLI